MDQQPMKYSTAITAATTSSSISISSRQQQQKQQQFRLKRELFAVFLFICYCSSNAVLAFSTPTTSHQIMTMKTTTTISSNSNKVQKLGNNNNNNKRRRRNNPRLQTGRRRSGGIQSGTPLEMICQNQQEEFELHVGHAMDVLRQDYSVILTQNPGMYERKKKQSFENSYSRRL